MDERSPVMMINRYCVESFGMIIIMLIIGLIKDNFIPVGSGVRYFILINNG